MLRAVRFAAAIAVRTLRVGVRVARIGLVIRIELLALATAAGSRLPKSAKSVVVVILSNSVYRRAIYARTATPRQAIFSPTGEKSFLLLRQIILDIV